MKRTLLTFLVLLTTQVASCSATNFPVLDKDNANHVTLYDGDSSYTTDINNLEWMKSKDFETFYHYNDKIKTEIFIFVQDDMVNSFAGIKMKGKESQVSSSTLMKENNIYIYEFTDEKGDAVARILAFVRPEMKLATYCYQAF